MRSASSKSIARILWRIAVASSMVFKPGAHSCHSSCPKNEVCDPVAIISESYSSTAPSCSVTCFKSGSTSVTVPSKTRVFFWPLKTPRNGAAISPAESEPVAT